MSKIPGFPKPEYTVDEITLDVTLPARIKELEAKVRILTSARTEQDMADMRVGAAIRTMLRRGAEKILLEYDDASWKCYAGTRDNFNEAWCECPTPEEALEKTARCYP